MFVFEFPSDKIEDADVNSSEVIDDWYSRDKSFVFYEGKKINNCDTESFSIFNAWFSKDKNNVYFENTILEDADLETFRIDDTMNNTAGDKNYLYIIDLDSNEIERLSNK